MRLLCAPSIGISNVLGDSDWHSLKEVMVSFTEKHKCFFYVLLPRKAHIEAARADYPYKNALFIESPNDIGDYHRDALFLDMAMWRKTFSAKAGRYLVDAVISSRIPMHVPMALAISDMRRRGSVPVISHEPLPLRTEDSIPLPERLARATGYVYSPTWVVNKFQEDIILDLLKKHTSSAMVKEFMRKRNLRGRGLDFGMLQKYCERPKFKKFSMVFGARINTLKRAWEAFSFFEKMVAYGRDIDVYLTQPKSGINESVIPNFFKRKSFLKLYIPNCSKEHYLAILSHAHCSVCTSRLEGEPRGFLEQLYILNGLTLFPDKAWARATLPPDFPWFYKTPIEGHKILRYFHEHHKEALKRSSGVRKWLEENRNQEGVLDDEWVRIRSAVAEYWATSIPKPGYDLEDVNEDESFRKACAVLSDSYKKRGVLEFSKFRNELMQKSRSIKFGVEGALRAPAVYCVYVDLLKEGWRDTYTTPEPILKWRGSN